MKTHVEFRSDAFPPYPGEEDEINPGVWGRRLAEFVHDGLKAQDFDVIEPAAEDWGWMVEIRNDAFRLWVGCGNLDGEPDGLLLFIEPSTPFVRKFFVIKIPTETEVSKVRAALEKILSTEDSITDVRWSTREEFGR